MSVMKRCTQCGSTNIVCQALAKWVREQHEWVFDLQIDPEYCGDCESFEIEDVELDDKEEEEDA